MADMSKELIEQMTETIFRNRQDRERRTLNEELAHIARTISTLRIFSLYFAALGLSGV